MENVTVQSAPIKAMRRTTASAYHTPAFSITKLMRMTATSLTREKFGVIAAETPRQMNEGWKLRSGQGASNDRFWV